MAPVFKSGAFVQQCFSVHPLCLSVKKFVRPDQLLLACTSCQLTHRLAVASIVVRLPGQDHPAVPGDTQSVDQFLACLEEHRTALGVCAMDVVRDAAGIRCAECRRTFGLEMAAIETHQR